MEIIKKQKTTTPENRLKQSSKIKYFTFNDGRRWADFFYKEKNFYSFIVTTLYAYKLIRRRIDKTFENYARTVVTQPRNVCDTCSKSVGGGNDGRKTELPRRWLHCAFSAFGQRRRKPCGSYISSMKHQSKMGGKCLVS